MCYGIDIIVFFFWNGQVFEFVVLGFNVGSNVYVQVYFFGIVGVVFFVVKERRVFVIVFFGLLSGMFVWNMIFVLICSLVYVQVVSKFVDVVVSSGKFYLFEDVFFNVNLFKVEGKCIDFYNFKFVFSWINVGLFSVKDVYYCGMD